MASHSTPAHRLSRCWASTFVQVGLILLCAAGLGGWPAPAAAAPLSGLRTDTWVTNGAVYATVQAGNTIYLGGKFSYVGPSTGSFVQLDTTSGVAAPLPVTNGSLCAIAADGAGGWYIGGDFETVAGGPRNNLAHIRADGTLDPAWTPTANGPVLALAVSGNTVYAGGYFTSVAGQARTYIAAIDATTGITTDWSPSADRAVQALAVSGNTVYAGGYFTSVGGQARNHIAAIDATSGLASAWNPNANSLVLALAVSGSTVYAGGDFTSIGGQARNNIAAIDASSGLASAWNPNVNSYVNTLAAEREYGLRGGRLHQRRRAGPQPHRRHRCQQAGWPAPGIPTPIAWCWPWR